MLLKETKVYSKIIIGLVLFNSSSMITCIVYISMENYAEIGYHNNSGYTTNYIV